MRVWPAVGGRHGEVRRADMQALSGSRIIHRRFPSVGPPPLCTWAVQRWAEGRNPFRIEAAGDGHEVRTRQLWAALQRASSRDGWGISVAPLVYPFSALRFK